MSQQNSTVKSINVLLILLEEGGKIMSILVERRDVECNVSGCCTAGSCPSNID